MDSSDSDLEVAAPVLLVGPTLTALESTENAVFSEDLPTTVTRQNARVALGRLARRAQRDLYRLRPQPSPSPSQLPIADRAWSIIQRAFAGHCAWFDASQPWVLRCRDILQQIRAIVEAGRTDLWQAIESVLGGQGASELEKEKWWNGNATTKIDSRPGMESSFPRTQAEGVYLMKAFLARRCVTMVDRSSSTEDPSRSYRRHISRKASKNYLLYQIIRQALDEGGHFICTPTIITATTDTASQLQHDATAVAELYVAIVLGTWQREHNSEIMSDKGRSDEERLSWLRLDVSQSTRISFKIALRLGFRSSRATAATSKSHSRSSRRIRRVRRRRRHGGGQISDHRGANLQNIVARTMLYELRQLFGRLSTILALLQCPEEAPSAITTSAAQLAESREALEEEIATMKTQVMDEMNDDDGGWASDEEVTNPAVGEKQDTKRRQ